MVKIWSRDSLAKKDSPTAQLADPNFRLGDHFTGRQGPNGTTLAEFIGTGNFGRDFIYRQQYEVDAGRDEEPLLIEPIYNVVRDANLPKYVDIDLIGPGGFVFEEVSEGGEVKFASFGSSSKAVVIKRYAVGLEYSQDLIDFNMMWKLASIERNVGTAHNALLNHIHLSPILDYSYTSANQTAANTDGDSIVENFLRTLEDADVAGVTDTSNPRRGPYTLLVSTSDLYTVLRALDSVPQQGLNLQGRILQMIRNVVAYDGWTGTRGGKVTTYSGVTAGKAYLISQANRAMDFQSYFKADLTRTAGDKDLSRFITGSDIWYSQFGVYSAPDKSVEEITWPTTA